MSLQAKQDPWLEEGCRIKRRTERALLVVLTDGTELWIPIAVCEVTMMGDNRCDVVIDHWWALKEGLI